MENVYFIAAIALFLSACTTVKKYKVNRMPGGVYRSFAADKLKQDAYNNAIDGANTHCENKGKEAVIISEDKKYSGILKEGKERQIASYLPIIRDIGRSDDDYSVTIKFKCEK